MMRSFKWINFRGKVVRFLLLTEGVWSDEIRSETGQAVWIPGTVHDNLALHLLNEHQAQQSFKEN
ncbi:hypothetical protein SAMN05444392_10984 [Seinonella peptonophila]|uniref:Uncharacterized protein n=1 Tax=Seinonella peptonophila TaxID=112248 RepID=A0A1M4ZJ37_9BACL|nr:hypothetical protein SAMN05444392_10984 [Seinonella peptonophila]